MTTIGDAAATAQTTWVRVCALDDLTVERGRAALIGDTQIALFRLVDGTVRAVSNYDPYGLAHVLSRGIVGSKAFTDGSEVPTIASPLHKQAWDLRTGAVVETQGKDERHIAVHPVAVDDGQVLIKWKAA
ncbi:nitrite reductase small subunit NirD [Microbacterium suaedae]|uniref:nitrite reductase small subunit NirD n=1 Tax=Microbacterium suaedae TaxID=2067813 RepID=UPI000DA18416|nr:nitrite reductase small subunit NirD [Microbacterium suaedae]